MYTHPVPLNGFLSKKNKKILDIGVKMRYSVSMTTQNKNNIAINESASSTFRCNRKVIAIDPGATGAMVWTDRDVKDNLFFAKITSDLAKNSSEIIKAVRMLGSDIIAYVEDVGKHRIGNNASASVSLARNHQNIITTLYMLGIETVSVSPQKWTKELGVQIKDERTKEEKLRVRSLEAAERNKENARNNKAKKDKKTEKINTLILERWGDIKVPKYAADAYGIYLYAEKDLGITP